MSTQEPLEDRRDVTRVVVWVLVALLLALVLLYLGMALVGTDDEDGGALPPRTPSRQRLDDTRTVADRRDEPDAGPVAHRRRPTDPPPGTGSGTGDGTSTGGRPFTMTATVVGGTLRPGVVRSLRIVVTNPNASAIELQRIDVSVGAPGSPGCLASWVDVGSFRSGTDPTTVVAGHGTGTVVLPIELVNLATVNQDACKASTFPLALTGTARQVTS